MSDRLLDAVFVKGTSELTSAAGLGGDRGPSDGLVASSKRGLPPLWGWIGLGAGATMVGTGAVFSILAGKNVADVKSLDATYRDDPSLAWTDSDRSKRRDLESSTGTNRVVAGVMYGLGGVAIAGAATYLVFFGDFSSAQDKGEVAQSTFLHSLGIAPTAYGTGLTVFGAW